jgi:GTPase SAR1 family protein
MNNVNYSTLFCFKICVLGSAGVGKTAIINRILSNSFPILYEPTTSVERYTGLFNLNDVEVKEKTFAMVTLEDTFGLNNPLLQTPEHLLSSQDQILQRKLMAQTFKDIMFTSTLKRDKISLQSKKPKKDSSNAKVRNKNFVYEKIFNDDPEIEIRGYIFVCDLSDQESINGIDDIIEKLHQIEKSNNLFYPKCIMLNKLDKITDKEKLKNIIKTLDNHKSKHKCDIFKVSALTNNGITEYFKKFLSKIHQQEIDNKQNEGLDDFEEDEEKADPVYNL